MYSRLIDFDILIDEAFVNISTDPSVTPEGTDNRHLSQANLKE